MAMTALPPLASSSSAADWSPVVAAAQRVVVACSSADTEPLDDEPPPKPPPPPPPKPLLTGPELGIDPECGWPAVDSAYAADPVNPESTATITVTIASRLARDVPRATSAALITPAARTAQRSHGCQLDVRLSRMKSHTPVAKSISARLYRAAIEERARHSSRPPMATSAPIAGASATV
jgi:hypothetical protein